MVNLEIGEPYLDDLGKNLNLLLHKVRKAGILKDSAEVQRITNGISFVLAADDLIGGEEGQAVATKILIQSAVRACEKTGEYDYPLFIGRLISAIMGNGTGLFEFNLADYSIKANLTPLGHAAQWIAAANAVRLRFAIGKSRLAKKPIDGMEPRYKFWMEKIYKPAREGVPIPEKKKKVPQVFPKLDKMWGKPKVSADQKAKYDKVIKARLAQFSMKEAPFWEVINNGNATVGYGGSSAPYPLFGPTNFVDESGIILTGLFRESMAIYRPKVEAALYRSMIKDVEVKKEGRTKEEYAEAVVETTNEETEEIRRGLRPEPLGTQTMTKIHTAEAVIELYKTTTKVPSRFRALAGSGKGGQFIRKMFDIE